MLTKFYFDESLLSSECFMNELTGSCHDSFLSVWRKYGIYIVCGSQKDTVKNIISSVPVKHKKKWTLAMERYAKLPSLRTCPVDSNDFEKYKQYSNEFETLFVDDCRGVVVCDDSYVKYDEDSSFEIVSAGSLDESVNFKRTKNLYLQDIQKGESPSKIWSSRFKRFSEIEKNIVIVDQYALKNIIESVEKGKDSSIKGILQCLKGEGKHSITIYSSGESINRSDAIAHFGSLLKTPVFSKCISKIRVISVDKKIFKISTYAHERYFRFGSYVLQVGSGMSIFDTYTTGMCTFSVKPIENTYSKEIEAECRKSSNWIEDFT